MPTEIKNIKLRYGNKLTTLKEIPHYYKGVNKSVSCTLKPGNFVKNSQIKNVNIDRDTTSNIKHNENLNYRYFDRKYYN